MVLLALGLFACGPPPPAPPRPTGEPRGEARPAAASEPPETQDDDDLAPEPAAHGPDVTIKLMVDARLKAHVFWGRKDLGVAPITFKRPSGSGPMDLLISADGCLPLHTRVFTDRDDSLAVRLYSESEAGGLLGHPR
jgi:hypothetical protein